MADRPPSRESSQNEILARITAAELATLMRHASEVSFPIKQQLFDRGDAIESVYFPLTGMISLVIVLQDGPTIEAMTVGKEGFVGLPLLNDVSTARYRGVCQIEGTFLTVNAKTFISILDSLPDLTRRLRRYSQYAIDVVSQSAACNTLHSAEQRLCRWLLHTLDRADGDVVMLTHSFLAQMLGLRRTTVTEIAGALQERGLIRYRGGAITVLKQARLNVSQTATPRGKGKPFRKEDSMAMLYASEMSSRVTNKAVQVFGGYGYVTEYHVERYLRDAKLTEIGEGTSEVQRIVIARQLGLGS